MIPTPVKGGAGVGFVPHCGGAVFNTAVALGRLGAPVAMLTGLSRDMFGTQLAAALRESRVQSTHLIFSDRPTTLAFVRMVNGQARYHFYDENSAGRMVFAHQVPALPQSVRAMYFGGISLACEPCGEFYAAALEQHGKGRVVMIDPNVRPAFIADEARYRARLAGMVRQADIVKLSDEDMGWLFPQAASEAEAAALLLREGAAVVILTRGGSGATAFLSGGQRVESPPQPVKVVDTVGAGDSFSAAVLAKLHELDLLSKSRLRKISAPAVGAALSYGTQVAALTVGRAGCNPPWAHEL